MREHNLAARGPMTDRNSVVEQLRKYRFYHVIKLADDLYTPGYKDHFTINVTKMILRALGSIELRGKRVLDIGCRDGIVSFEAERLGASEVIAIDNDLSLGAVDFLIPYFNSKVRMHRLNLYDLRPDTYGMFDVVCFPGVLYHLRYPFWGLKAVRDVLKSQGYLVMHTILFVDDNRNSLLWHPIGADATESPTCVSFFNLKGLADALYSLGISVRRVEFWDHHPIKDTPPRPVGLSAVLSHVRDYLRGLPSGSEPKKLSAEDLTQATLICQMTPEVINREVAKYWDATHDLHSQYDHVGEGHPIWGQRLIERPPVSEIIEYLPEPVDEAMYPSV